MIKRLVIDNAVLIIQYAVNGLVPLLLVPHIIKQIGLESYGELAIALAWASYGVTLINYSFHLTGPKRVAQLKPGTDAGTVLRDIAATKFLLLACVYLLLAVIFTLLYAAGDDHSILVIAVLLPLGAAFNSAWFLQAMGRFPLICTISILGCALALTVGFGLVEEGQAFGKVYAAVALGIATAFFGIVTFLAAIGLSGASAAKISINAAFRLLAEGWPLFISQMVAAVYMLSGPIFIGYALGATEAGSYSAIERIVNPLIAVCLLTYTASYPRLAGLYGSNQNHYHKLLRLTLLGYFALSFLLVLVMFVAEDWLLRYFFGELIPVGIEKMLYAGMVLILMSIFGTAYTGHLTIIGQERRVLPLTIKVLVVTLLAGIPGVLFVGPWAWMAALALSQFVVLYAALRSDLGRRFLGGNRDETAFN